MQPLVDIGTSRSRLALPLFISLTCFGLISRVRSNEEGGEEDEINYYTVLGVSQEATEKEIRQKYRELSRKYHPDVATTAGSREMYSKISRANEVLSDKRKRRMYDILGEEGLRMLKRLETDGKGGDFTSLSQLFSYHAAQRLKGKNSEAVIQVPLELVYTGGQRVVTLSKQKVCVKCRGTGARRLSDRKTCPRCRGNGFVRQRLQIGVGMFQEIRQTCPSCKGRGSITAEQCHACQGHGVHQANVDLTLDVEVGMPEGHVVTFEMEADESPDLIPGDLLLSVRTKPHPTFSRRSNNVDLDMKLVVSLKEALLGFKRRVKHLDGTEFSVSATGVTQYGTVIKVRGKGMPRYGAPMQHGDLYVEVLFDMPNMLSEEQKKDLREHL